MASLVKLVGLILCMVSLVLEMKGFEDLQSVPDTGNDRFSTAFSFKDEALSMTTTELIGWYIILIISLIKPGGLFSAIGTLFVLVTGFLSVISTQVTYGYVEQSGVMCELFNLKMAALLNITGLIALLGYSLDRLIRKIPGFE